MKNALMIIGAVAIIIVAIVLLQKNGVKTTAEIPLDNNEEMVKNMTDSGGEKGEDMMKDEIVEMNDALEERANLLAVGDYSGSGIATRVYDGEEFVHTVSADVSAPREGKFYEGWLVKGRSFFSTGELIEKDGVYFVEYRESEDRSDYVTVVITEETRADGFDNKPEAHVLEGEFTVQK